MIPSGLKDRAVTTRTLDHVSLPCRLAVRTVVSFCFGALALVALTAPAGAQQSLGTCRERLSFLHQALTAYAKDHAGALPAKLSTLYTDKYVACELWAFWCPQDAYADKSAAHLDDAGSYELVATQLDPTSSQPLLREREARHESDGAARESRHVLLQNGQVIAATDTVASTNASAAPCASVANSPPTVQFAGESPTEWGPCDSVAYEWSGSDDHTPSGSLQYRYSFSLTGLSDWTTATRVVLGRLRPGAHALAVWSRDEAGAASSTPAYLTFRVSDRNRINPLGSSERRMRPPPKAPGDPLPPPGWGEGSSRLRQVDLSLSDPEPGADTSDSAPAATGPGHFAPGQPAPPLVLQRHFEWLHALLHFEVKAGQCLPDCAYELSRDGRSLGGQDFADLGKGARLLHLRLHMATGNTFAVGRYCLVLTVSGSRACELYFDVVDPPAPTAVRQALRPETLTGLALGADKSRRLGLASGELVETAPPPQSAAVGQTSLPLSAKKPQPGS
jgi:hypothetical protein